MCGNPLGRAQAYQKLILAVLVAQCVILALTVDVFLTWPNILNILSSSATIGILAIGATMVIGAGGLDLSVGSLIGLCSIVAVTLIPDSAILILSVCLLTGAVMGVVNGSLIGALKLPPFIVTLAMLSFARGLALMLSDGRPVYGLPDAVVFLGQGYIAGIPIPVFIFLGVVLIGHILLRHTKFGQHGLAIGDNEKAAQSAGIRTARYKIVSYAFSGLMASIAALIYMGRINAADPNAGVMYELTAITAVIIGGTSLAGGKASVSGTLIGTLIVGVLQNGLTLMNIPAYYQQMVIGVVLICAVMFGQYRSHHALAN